MCMVTRWKAPVTVSSFPYILDGPASTLIFHLSAPPTPPTPELSPTGVMIVYEVKAEDQFKQRHLHGDIELRFHRHKLFFWVFFFECQAFWIILYELTPPLIYYTFTSFTACSRELQIKMLQLYMCRELYDFHLCCKSSLQAHWNNEPNVSDLAQLLRRKRLERGQLEKHQFRNVSGLASTKDTRLSRADNLN